MHPARSPGNVRSVSDPAFPSGQWIGFYTYANQTKRYLVDLILEFRDGMISGEGADGIGFLGIDGRYYSKEAECSRIKTYFGEMNVEDLKCNKCNCGRSVSHVMLRGFFTFRSRARFGCGLNFLEGGRARAPDERGDDTTVPWKIPDAEISDGKSRGCPMPIVEE